MMCFTRSWSAMSLTSCLLLALGACGKETVTDIVPPVPSPTTQWDATVRSNGLPVEAAGRIAIPNQADFTLSGLDPATGVSLWLRTLPQGTVAVESFGELFVANKLGAADSTAATVIDPVSGLNLWSVPVAALQQRLVLRVGSTIVAQINDTVLVGLDRTSGNESWRVRLRPLATCTPGNCGRLSAIGVDRGDGYILRQSSTEAQIITVRETGVVSQILAQSAVFRRAAVTDQRSAVVGAGLAVVASGGEVAGVDVATGAERWRVTFSTLVPATYNPVPATPQFTSDGAFVIAQLSDANSAREFVLNTTTGQIARQRAILRSQLTSFNSRCGADGYVYVGANAFEYTNLRTGLVSTLERAGFLSTVTTAGLTNSFPTANGYLVFSLESSRVGRHVGVKCTPG